MGPERDMDLVDVARVVLLQEMRFSSCVLCGAEITQEGMMVCNLHAAQVCNELHWLVSVVLCKIDISVLKTR